MNHKPQFHCFWAHKHCSNQLIPWQGVILLVLYPLHMPTYKAITIPSTWAYFTMYTEPLTFMKMCHCQMLPFWAQLGNFKMMLSSKLCQFIIPQSTKSLCQCTFQSTKLWKGIFKEISSQKVKAKCEHIFQIKTWNYLHFCWVSKNNKWGENLVNLIHNLWIQVITRQLCSENTT